MNIGTNQIKAFAENIALPAEALQEVLPVCDRWIKAYAEEYNRIKTNAFVNNADAEITAEIKAFAEKQGGFL